LGVGRPLHWVPNASAPRRLEAKNLRATRRARAKALSPKPDSIEVLNSGLEPAPSGCRSRCRRRLGV